MSLIDTFLNNNQKTIRIETEGTMTVTLDELYELHNYADVNDTDYEHLKNSILRLGYKFPAFVWIDQDGKKWIVDAHGRKKTLIRMRDKEGYFIPPLPAVRIFAKDKKEAKEALLAQESKFKKITQEGMYDFINEPGFELEELELPQFTDIDVINYEVEAHTPIQEGDENGKDETCVLCTTYHAANHVAQTTE